MYDATDIEYSVIEWVNKAIDDIVLSEGIKVREIITKKEVFK